jgi:hypothetical protein
MTPLVQGRAYLTLTFISKRLCDNVVFLSLLVACLATFVVLARSEQCDDDPANLQLDSVSGGLYRMTYYDRNTGNCDLVNLSGDNSAAPAPHGSGDGVGSNAPVERFPASKPPDFNREVYFRNKFEFSQDVGWLPINIPFPFDFMLSDQYQTYPLKYTLVPVISSLRWQIDSIKGPMILRGNWELDISGAVVAIPRGAETRYFTYIMGMRRNFVPRNWRATPYFDWRAGLGDIDAKGPLGVPYAQGQNFTFTLNMGSGVRYNLSPRYAITVGLNWMHISNANLSEHKYDPADKYPWGFINYGINVYGPMFGVDIQLRKHQRHSE